MSPKVIHDVVVFLSTLLALCECQQLYHLLKLKCMCLSSQSTSLPIVIFGNICSDKLILPVQSFIVNSPQSVSVCSTDLAVDDFLKMCVDFDESALESTYDPWRDMNHFECAKTHKKLSVTYRDLIDERNAPRSPRVRSRQEASSELVSLRPSKRVRPRQCFGSLSQSEVAKGIADLQQG